MKTTSMLFLAANPVDRKNLDRRYLALDEELRTIQEQLQAAPARDHIGLTPILAARPDDWLRALNADRFRVVHFSGHGTRTGALHHVGRDGTAQAVSFEALKATLRLLKGDICLIVLNACYSRQQAEMLVEEIDCVLAMNDEIHDRVAITFMQAFYRALFAGRAVQDAFAQGKAALLLAGLPESHVPELLVRPGVNAAHITLLASSVRNKAFLAFSPDDKHFLQELHTHLTYGEEKGLLRYWDTTRLEPGTRQREETLRALESTRIAVLLLSASFFASKVIMQEQLPLLLQAADRSEARIICVLVRPVSSVGPDLAPFVMVNEQPLSAMNQARRENVWSYVTRLVQEHLQREV
jgi:hypothetical protein